jgi:antitoxin YefM
MRTINFSDARGNLKEVLDNVTSDHSITLIKRRDSEDAVVMSLSDYNSLQETLYLFGNVANAARLHAAMAEADAAMPKGARVLGPEDIAEGASSNVPAKPKAKVAHGPVSGVLIRRVLGVETKVKAGYSVAGRALAASMPNKPGKPGKPTKAGEYKAAAVKVTSRPKKKA